MTAAAEVLRETADRFESGELVYSDRRGYGAEDGCCVAGGLAMTLTGGRTSCPSFGTECEKRMFAALASEITGDEVPDAVPARKIVTEWSDGLAKTTALTEYDRKRATERVVESMRAAADRIDPPEAAA